MDTVKVFKNTVLGAAAGIGVVTVLPVFGAAGVITATGFAVGSLLGGVYGFTGALNDETRESKPKD